MTHNCFLPSTVSIFVNKNKHFFPSTKIGHIYLLIKPFGIKYWQPKKGTMAANSLMRILRMNVKSWVLMSKIVATRTNATRKYVKIGVVLMLEETMRRPADLCVWVSSLPAVSQHRAISRSIEVRSVENTSY